MLKIKCLSREELITFLTQEKGKLASNYALISIKDPDDAAVISEEGRPNVLNTNFIEDTFGPDRLSLSEGIRIFNFIRFVVTDIMKTNPHSVLIVQSKSGLCRAGAVAEFAAEYLTPYELVDFEYYLANSLLNQPHKGVLDKLYTVQNLLTHFEDDHYKLPYLAYKILTDAMTPSSRPLLLAAAQDYLINLFDTEVKRLKILHPHLRFNV